ncbi:MAG: secondary thiamine-phosphate synthase enzyme YjbQ [Myxococcota bacterium]
MIWLQQTVTIETSGKSLVDVTARVAEVVRRGGVEVGLCHLFVQHTSASLVIQENADPDVLSDLLDWFGRAAQDGDPRHRHVDEGPDDMSAHIRSAITATSTTIPIEGGRLALGTWQAVYLFEHRSAPRSRRIVVTVQGR